VPFASPWSPESPMLYDLLVSMEEDSILGYFGLRTFELGRVVGRVHPLLNGDYTFLIGFLDQSWWPDGQYTAPSDEALEYDLKAAKMFGMNMVRLHQKVNPERWYYHADRHGLVVFQDMVQKNDGATAETIPYFVQDMKSTIAGRGNHPSILQWDIFNELDCVKVFDTPPYDVEGMVDVAQKLDPTRLVDTDSGPPNFWRKADVNDLHVYPGPWLMPSPSEDEYAMVGEFGGGGIAVEGREWVPGGCNSHLELSSAAALAEKYIGWAKLFEKNIHNVSAAVYTQLTDVELECDGFLNYDRSQKLNSAQTRAIREANAAIVSAGRHLQLAGQIAFSLVYSPLR